MQGDSLLEGMNKSWEEVGSIERANKIKSTRFGQGISNCSSWQHSINLTSYSTYLLTSLPLHDPFMLGRTTSYHPLKTIGTLFLGHYTMTSALLWVMPRGW